MIGSRGGSSLRWISTLPSADSSTATTSNLLLGGSSTSPSLGRNETLVILFARFKVSVIMKKVRAPLGPKNIGLLSTSIDDVQEENAAQVTIEPFVYFADKFFLTPLKITVSS